MILKINFLFMLCFSFVLQTITSAQSTDNAMEKIIYMMDPHCGWCFGNSNNINEVVNQHRDSLQFEIMVGGMWLDEDAPYGGSDLTRFLGQHAPQMADAIGVHLDPNYYKLAMDSSYQFSSLEPSAAIVLVKQLASDKAFHFTSEVQKALFIKGQKLNELSTYLPILNQLGINAIKFTNQWLSKDNLEKTRVEFTKANVLASSYPSLIKYKDGEISILAEGYLEKEEIIQLLKP